MRLKDSLPVLVLVAGVGAVFYLWHLPHQSENPPIPATTTAPAPSVASSPSESPLTVQNPVSEEEAPEGAASYGPLPSLDQSDPSFGDALRDLFGQQRLDSLFNLNSIIRRIVVTVDNLAGHKQPSQEFSPLKELDSDFVVSGKKGNVTIADSNSTRYAPYVSAFQGADVRKMVGVYRHFYPLFQSAYKELGKRGYFNDQLIRVIDQLLATPTPQKPIKLMRLTKHSRYKFVDGRLESLSSGQKILIRIGEENATIVKIKLREIRGLLTHLGH